MAALALTVSIFVYRWYPAYIARYEQETERRKRTQAEDKRLDLPIETRVAVVEEKVRATETAVREIRDEMRAGLRETRALVEEKVDSLRDELRSVTQSQTTSLSGEFRAIRELLEAKKA